MFDFGQIKQKRNILMTSLFRRDCVCQSSALHVSTPWSYILTLQLHTTHMVSSLKQDPDLGSRPACVTADAFPHPRTWTGPAWGGMILKKKRLLVTLHALCAFCGKSVYTGKENFFFFFCNVKQDSPLSILFTPF